MTKRRSYYFFNDMDALVFAAKVNERASALSHYGRALVRTDLEDEAVEFLSRVCRRLRREIADIKAKAA